MAGVVRGGHPPVVVGPGLIRGDPNTNDREEDFPIMRAPDPEVARHRARAPDCSVDASPQNAPRAADGVGPSPVDRGKRGGGRRCSPPQRHPPRVGGGGRQPQRRRFAGGNPGGGAKRGLAASATRCTSTAATTRGVVRSVVAAAGIGTPVCPKCDPAVKEPSRSTCLSGCAGRSSGPTAGSRPRRSRYATAATSTSSAATPTAGARTACPAGLRRRTAAHGQAHRLAHRWSPG